MAERIDELQLLIGSDASRAIEQLGALAGALDTAASSTRKLAGATGYLSSFSVALSRIANTNLDRAICSLEKLSRLDLSNLKNKTISIDLQVNGADRVDRLKYATNQAAKDVEKSASAMADSLGKNFRVDDQGLQEMRDAIKSIITDLGNQKSGQAGVKSLINAISDGAHIATADLTGMREQYVRFLKDVETLRINPASMSTDEFLEWRDRGLQRLLDNKSTVGIDQILGWDSEFVSRNQNVMDAFSVPDDAPSQFVYLREKIDECKAALNGFVKTDQTTEAISAYANDMRDQLQSMIDEATTKRMAKTKNAIPLDLSIDQNKFESQIQSAINQATSKTYSTKPIKLKIDNQQLRDNVEAAFAMVDIAKLPQFAEGFEKVANSISTMNQSGIKDSGITQFANTLRKLVNTDTSKFDVAALNGISAAIKDMASVGNIDRSLNSFVSSISRLANAGEKAGQAADGMKKLTPELKSAANTFSKLGAIDATLTSFIASLSKLASAGQKTSQTADGLSKLSSAVMEFLNALKDAPEINENVAATIQGLGNLAAAGTAAGKTMNNVLGGGSNGSTFGGNIANTAIRSTTSSLKGLLNISLQLGRQGASALGNFLGKLNLIPTQANSIDRTALTFGNLLRAILPFYGIKGLFDWGKEALEAGSSIVELENVIDTSFGSLKKGYEDISGYIYKWAETTIDAFGVSQIAAEKYAGRLMAMFNSSGFDITEGMRDSAAQMSVDLIERAGDIASFYDITVDEAMTKMQSGLAGMTRPLRSLGINMSVANMQAFALSQGITTTWQEMDQASQMALRYQYILHATQYAEGDFQKTSMSLANQLRLLTLNFQMLSTTIGQGLVSAIAPAISWLNLLIKRLIQAATAFRTFMWTLFGKPLQAARGTADDMAGYLDDASGAASGLADGAGGAADSLGSAGKAAKNLKKQLQVLPFDELNQLAKDTEAASSGGSGGGGGTGGGGLGNLGDFGIGNIWDYDLSGNELVDGINKWAQRIKKAFVQQDWQGVGKNIAYFLNHGFGLLYDILDWKKVGPKVYGFIQPFQASINSLMYYIDWEKIGRTFARGLNDITYTLRAWINGFNWRQWGGLIADGMDSMLDEWDADAFGRLIADKFRAAWNFFGGWVKHFNFKQLGTKMKEMINGAITEMNWSDMGETLAGFFNGVNDAIISFFEDGTVSDNLAKAFGDFVNSFVEKFDAEKAKKAMETVKEALKSALSTAIGGINKDDLAEDFKTLLSGLPWDAIGVAIGAKVGFDLLSGLFSTVLKASVLKGVLGAGGASLGGATAGGVASAGATAAATGGALTFGTIAGGTLAVTAVTIGAIELGKWLKSKGIGKNNIAENKANAADKLVQGQQKNNEQLQAQGINAAGYNTQLMTVPQTATISNTTLTATVDASFKQALADKQELVKDPKVTKTVDSKKTKEFTANQKAFMAWVSDRVDKTANGKFTNAYNTVRSNFFGWTDQTSTKTANAQKTSAYGTVYSHWTGWTAETVKKSANAGKTNAYTSVFGDWRGWISETALKTANATKTQGFVNVASDYNNLDDKTITVTVDVETAVNEVVADINGAIQTLARIRTRKNAAGGLFTGATGFQVFGEAGAEAAIPLERKSTMKRIASAIVDSGGGLNNNSDEVADAIAKRILPALAGMMSDANSRPVQVNATLYTENDEVLARAVTRGQRSIDKRYNPVSQFSY